MAVPDLVTVGRVLRPRGLKGQVKILSLAASVNRFSELTRLYWEKNKEGRWLDILKATNDGKFVYLLFKNISRVEDAELLRGGALKIEPGETAPAEEGAFRQFDLIGLTVKTDAHQVLGRVKEVFHYPSCDTLSVEAPGGREILLPMTKTLIQDIDVPAGEIRVAASGLGDIEEDTRAL